jgi:hypothetical protein
VDVTELIARLDSVRKSGADSWVARCPAHEDRSPSLTVKGLPDGRILLHCFAGCEAGAVLDSLGLSFAELFPERLGEFSSARAAFTPLEALRALTFESSVVAICAADIVEGKLLSATDADRVCLAAGRIASALEFIHGC